MAPSSSVSQNRTLTQEVEKRTLDRRVAGSQYRECILGLFIAANSEREKDHPQAPAIQRECPLSRGVSAYLHDSVKKLDPGTTDKCAKSWLNEI